MPNFITQSDPALKSSVRIPSPPPLLGKIQGLLKNPDSHLEEIAETIQKDAGITAALFRILSSPVLGLKHPPEDIRKAIALVGLETLANLIKSISLKASIYGDSPFYPWFWERANDIATYASIIAQRQRTVCNIFPEHAHLAALFLDCGVPILAQQFPNYTDAFIGMDGFAWPQLAIEDKKYNTDHAVVGYLAAKHWHLPTYVCKAIRWHHDPININDQAATLIAILQIAEHIHNTRANEADNEWPLHRDRVLEEVGIAHEGLREFEEDVYDFAQAGA